VGHWNLDLNFCSFKKYFLRFLLSYFMDHLKCPAPLLRKFSMSNDDDENSGNYDLCCYLETEHGVVMGSGNFISSKDFFVI
jgi:hypothetical protein